VVPRDALMTGPAGALAKHLSIPNNNSWINDPIMTPGWLRKLKLLDAGQWMMP
jgi:hypothetical protein